MFLTAVRGHIHDGGLVAEAAGVVAHAEVDVTLLAPVRGPAVTDDPVGSLRGRVVYGWGI